MRRLLCVFLLMWLPLQMSWAAVAGYCQHETNPAAQRHFGHHEHVHVTQAGGEGHVGLGTKHHGGGDKQASADNDCAICHLLLPTPVSEATPLAARPSGRVWRSRPILGHASNIPRGPERPDIELAV